MTRCATPTQSQEIDRRTQQEYSLSAELLMEVAGYAAAREIMQRVDEDGRSPSIAIVCGPGHNGGDGCVLARHLHAAGLANVVVYLAGPQKRGSDLYERQLQRLREFSIAMVRGVPPERMRRASVIIDAIFGVGLNRPIEGEFAAAVESINASSAHIVSLDGPSGLDGADGTVLACAVRARHTLTFGLAKPGFYVGEGPECTGKVIVLPIGFPPRVVREVLDA